MPVLQSLFYTYKVGKLTVIGFDARHLDGEHREACRDHLLSLVENNSCEYLVVDLMDVPIVESWILGVLAAIQESGVTVDLYHPTAAIREVLETTHLDSRLHVRQD